MAADNSWTNPGFEPDELSMRKSYEEKDQIFGTDGIDETTLNSKGRAYEELQMSQSLGGSKGNYTVNPPQEDMKEDYSLYSFIKDIHCLKPIINFFSSLSKNVEGLWSKLLLLALVFLFIAHFLAALILPSKQTPGTDERNYWCHEEGFLIIVYSIIVIFVLYFKVLKPLIGERVYMMQKKLNEEIFMKKIRALMLLWYVKFLFYAMTILAVVIFLIIDSRDDRSRLVSLMGIVLLLLFGFLFSSAPRKVIWRQVLWGLGLQFALGLMILRWSVGRETFNCLGEKVQAFLSYTDSGSTFVYGKLVSELHIFAFKVLTVILFFSFCINILYYYGAMQWIVIKLGWLLQVTVGTTACESVNAAANIFLGQSEAPLLIKPFLPLMTKSELHAVMTGGFSTIAGSVLAAYISFGVDAAHLLTASVMSAPAALGFAKLFYPEVEMSRTHAKDIEITKGTETNVLHAACEGVVSAIPLVANVAANLLAFIAFIAFVDGLFNWSCLLVGIENDVCTLSNAFGYIFMPLAFIMGVPWKDCYYVGQLIGTKTIVNEFVGYRNLVAYVEEDKISKRSEIIATYALCGFSNISGIGIQLGSLGAMAPERRGDLAKVALRAMIAGSVACFLTACVAGCLISVDEYGSSEPVGATPLQ